MDNVKNYEYGEIKSIPQDIDAEQAVLSAIFFRNGEHPNSALIEVMGILTPDDFYLTKHKNIYQAMIDLSEQEIGITSITIADKLSQKKQLESADGTSYLESLVDIRVVSANAGAYADIVREKSIARQTISKLTDTIDKLYANSGAPTDVLADLGRDIDKLSEKQNSSDFILLRDILPEVQQEIEQNGKQGQEITGLATGFKDLDKLTNGFTEDQLVIIAARPAVGKTAFILNIATNVAKMHGLPVVVFSLEMGASSIVQRMIASEGQIDSRHLQTGNLTPEEWSSLTASVATLARTQIYLDDTPGIKINEIRAKLRKLERELLSNMSKEERKNNPNPIGMVVIDYLQLIESNNSENRQQEVSFISRSLKKMAKELRVPILALSQLSRGVEKREDKRPVLSDIRESGSIEQDADIVAFLYRDDYYRSNGDDEEGEETEDVEIGPIEVIIEKNRAGARGTARLQFNKPIFKFFNMAPTAILNNFNGNEFDKF